MVLTADKVELVARYLAQLKHLINIRDGIKYIPLVLAPTLETEIQSIRDQIDTWRALNPNRTRTEYVTAIQPLRTQLIQKIAENETMIANNNLLLQVAQKTYSDAVAVEQTKFDNLEKAMKDYLKTIEASL